MSARFRSLLALIEQWTRTISAVRCPARGHLTRAGKLAGVLQGRYDPSILRTYETERSQVARQLIEVR